MAERVDHGNNRWMIAYGSYCGVEKYAVNEAVKVISQHVPYTLTVRDVSQMDPAQYKDFNILFLGTLQSNASLKALAEMGVFTPPGQAEGFCIKVTASPYGENRKIAVLCGTDPSGALYAVRDFAHEYVARQQFNHFNTVYNIPFKLFVDEMPDFTHACSPYFPLRGAWTWGHTILDYRRFIEHMSRFKLNCLTLWNDFVPVNAGDIIRYAHDRGIRVIWGYTWCWGEQVDPDNPEDVQKWQKRVLSTYEAQYRDIGIDGIYFQSFTEHSGEQINGRDTAELAADWVNQLAAPLLEKYPDIWLQFGLHATYVTNKLSAFQRIDPRISIVWEDFPAFPFHHDPQNIAKLEETLQMVQETSALRGETEKYGLVMKGLTMTNWLNFENQKGPFVLGESDEMYAAQRTEQVKFIWRYADTYWSKNLHAVLKSMQAVQNPQNPHTLVSVLLEDGMWEDHPWKSGAVFAEAAWNPNRTAEDILEQISLLRETSC